MVAELQDRTVAIAEFEKVEGGFFSSAYILFTIKLLAKDVSVKRKVADFVWLRECLIKEFPVSFIPPLFMTESRPNDLEYIQEQMPTFQDFIQEILYNDELKLSELLEAFLLLTDYTQFVEAKKQIDSMQTERGEFKSSISRRTIEYSSSYALNLEQLKTKDGHVASIDLQIDLKISNSLKNFYRSYNEINDTTKNYIGQLKDLSKHLHDSIKKTERIYKEMGRICALLHQSSVEFNQENINSENEVFERVFFSLQNMLLLQGESLKREASIAKTAYADTFAQWERELYALDDVPSATDLRW